MQGIDQVSQISPIQTYYASRVAAQEFSVPESPLRSGQVARTPAVQEKDPASDSVELARDYPQLLVGQTYSPPQPQNVLGLRDESTSAPAMDEGDDGSVSESDGNEGGTAETEAEDGEESTRPGEETDAKGQALSEGEQNQVRELKTRDQEVRTHEQAHKAVGGSYAGAVSYDYQQGPDGNRYAVGGEVSIDTSAEREPESTIAKMRQVRAAAMAPADPSPQDHSVAAQASQTEAQARKELAQQQTAEAGGGAGQSGESEEKAEEAGGGSDPSASSGAAGGTASLSSNPYVKAYENSRAETAYAAQGARKATSFAALASGYTPINVVA